MGVIRIITSDPAELLHLKRQLRFPRHEKRKILSSTRVKIYQVAPDCHAIGHNSRSHFQICPLKLNNSFLRRSTNPNHMTGCRDDKNMHGMIHSWRAMKQDIEVVSSYPYVRVSTLRWWPRLTRFVSSPRISTYQKLLFLQNTPDPCELIKGISQTSNIKLVALVLEHLTRNIG